VTKNGGGKRRPKRKVGEGDYRFKKAIKKGSSVEREESEKKSGRENGCSHSDDKEVLRVGERKEDRRVVV